jgi:hypothetical protein
MLKSINRYIINEYIKSLFVVITVMLSIVLLINLLDEFNFFKSKKDLRITIIITSEILLDLSSKKIYVSFFLYVAPFLLLMINWVLLNYFLNRENIKS